MTNALDREERELFDLLLAVIEMKARDTIGAALATEAVLRGCQFTIAKTASPERQREYEERRVRLLAFIDKVDTHAESDMAARLASEAPQA